MKIAQASDARAPKALLAYIRKNHGSIPAFAEASGIDRLKVQKVVRGNFQRVDVDFAFAVEKATGGEIPAKWWVGAGEAA